MPDCLTCREAFDSLDELERHRWRAHAGDVDLGTAFHGGAGRVELSSLVSDEECVSPPTLPR